MSYPPPWSYMNALSSREKVGRLPRSKHCILFSLVEIWTILWTWVKCTWSNRHLMEEEETSMPQWSRSRERERENIDATNGRVMYVWILGEVNASKNSTPQCESQLVFVCRTDPMVLNGESNNSKRSFCSYNNFLFFFADDKMMDGLQIPKKKERSFIVLYVLLEKDKKNTKNIYWICTSIWIRSRP